MLCPYCSEEIKDGAKKCRFCWEFLEETPQEEKVAEKKEVKTESKSSPFARWVWQFAIFSIWLIVFLALSSSSRVFVILTILICVWYMLCSNKDEKVFDFKSYIQPERYKNKIRVIIAWILVVIFWLLSLGQWHDAYEKEKAEQEYKIAYEQAPIPAIQVHSSEWELGGVNTYKLEATIKNATEVTIDWEPVEMIGEEISKDYTLINPELSIIIVAKNEYKEHSYTVTVSRDRTDEEQAAFEEQQKLEAERKAKEEEERRLQIIDNQKEEIWEMRRKIDTVSQTYDSLDQVTNTLDLFDEAKRILNKYDNSEYNEVKTSRKNLESKLSSTQKKLFPTLRKQYCSILNNKLWINDYEVKCSWTTITVIHHSFALNKNISDFHSLYRSTFENLRFKRVNYKWVDSSYAEYTYYTMETLSDWAIW